MTIKELKENPVKLIAEDWALVSAGTPESWNTMTVSWGGVGELWGRDCATIYIRPQRYTREFIDSNDYFTLLGVMIGYMAGIVFEKRYVNFENTRSFRLCALRLAGGVAVYFVLNVLLKAPFDAAFLESGTLAALLVRTGRYAVILFADIGLYPLLFQKLEKRFSRKKDGENNAI